MSEEIEGWQSRRLSRPVRPTKRVSAGRKKHNIRPSRLTETSAYEGWLLQQADRAKSKANFDSDPTVHAKNRMTARSERMRLFRRRLKGHSNTTPRSKPSNFPEAQTGLLKKYYFSYHDDQNTSQRSKVGEQDDSSTDDSDGQKAFENPQNFVVDTISTKEMQNHTWLKPDHVKVLENYAVVSPRANNALEGPNRDLPQHDQNKHSAEDYMMEIDNDDLFAKEIDSIEFVKFKNSILSMSKQVTSTYKNALGNIQSNQNREIEALKIKHKAEMDSIQKRYKDHIAHYLRQTKRLEAAEAAVRELIEINKRLSKGGQGSTIIPAHIHTKLASWDRKNDNENNRQRAESSYDKYLADETKAIIQSECENTSTIARVKPWTPTQNLPKRKKKMTNGRNSDKVYIANLIQKLNHDRREWEAKQAEWVENEQSQITMLQTLRQDNQILRYEGEKMQKAIQHLEADIVEKDRLHNEVIEKTKSQMEALEIRYAELQKKYRVCHKELKAYDMDNLRRRRKESFEKDLQTNGW